MRAWIVSMGILLYVCLPKLYSRIWIKILSILKFIFSLDSVIDIEMKVARLGAIVKILFHLNGQQLKIHHGYFKLDIVSVNLHSYQKQDEFCTHRYYCNPFCIILLRERYWKLLINCYRSFQFLLIVGILSIK